MQVNFRLGIRIAFCLIAGTALRVWCQADNVPPLSGAVLTQWQIQGEYYGTVAGGAKLGAWLVAKGNDAYTVVFLPGGLLTLPGQPYGGWDQTGWNRSTFSGTGTLAGTGFSVTTASNYKAATLSGSGEDRVMTGISPAGAVFILNRVVRNSPTHGLKPKPEWGAATLLFDSATGPADLAKWTQQDNTVQLSRKYLYRGVRTVATQGAGFLHIEFQGCFNPTATGQGRANSGVYIQGHYEAQVLDSFGGSGAIDDFGAVYSVKAPSVVASLPPLAWHTYDIYFTPRTSGAPGDAAGAATMTIFSNGVMTQDATPVTNVTTAGLSGSLLIPAPLYLQNHGNEVVFNNIWFIPNATVASLPYASVLGSTVGVKSGADRPVSGLAPDEAKESQVQFDLQGRRIQPEPRFPSVPLIRFAPPAQP